MRTGALEGQIGMDAALERSGPEWKFAANEAIDWWVMRGHTFTAEDLRALVGSPPNPNALGAVLHAAETDGRIRVVGMERSRRPTSHGRRILVWARA